MNPRKRRAIARAIVAGIPKNKLNSENIRKFLNREKEKGRLDLSEENIQDILFPKGYVNKPVTSNVTVVEETVTEEIIVEEEEAVEEVTTEMHEEAEDQELSLDNSKAELQAAAKDLGISFKKSFSKSKLLELINNN